MLKPAVRRSACDQCRAKRVRCLRAHDSTAPCARCNHLGARCVTGASGLPGRPPKQRLANGDDTRAPRNRVNGISGPDLVLPKSMSPRDPLAHEPQPDFWLPPGDGDSSAFFSSPSIEQSPAQLNSAPQLQGLLGGHDELDAMLHMGGDANTNMDMNIDPLLNHTEAILPPTPTIQCFSTAASLVGFREEIDDRIATIDADYSDHNKILQRCKDENENAGRHVENPAALLLTCTTKFIQIIQNLTPSADDAAQLQTRTEDAPTTELVLLALSSYLALMRLFDSLFHRIYVYLCEVPRETYESMKVKAVLRIGGFASLQDMPLKTYAMGILDAIQCQVKVLERCMGIPAEYCLSGEAAVSSSTGTASPGILCRADQIRLFWTVVAQEDVKSRRGTKSYVESIRSSIKESLAFLDDHVVG